MTPKTTPNVTPSPTQRLAWNGQREPDVAPDSGVGWVVAPESLDQHLGTNDLAWCGRQRRAETTPHAPDRFISGPIDQSRSDPRFVAASPLLSVRALRTKLAKSNGSSDSFCEGRFGGLLAAVLAAF